MADRVAGDVAGDTWEERMSARARARWSRVLEAQRSDDGWRASVREHNRSMAEHNAGVTLAEAIAWLNGPPWACACSGGPWCCVGRTAHARAMQRAAHIAVKLVTDLARSRIDSAALTK